MITRRQIRIKVMQALYAYYQDEQKDLAKSLLALEKNLKATYELYAYELAALNELHNFAAERIQKKLNKMLPTEEDLNPNMRFVDNPVLKTLTNSLAMETLYKQYKVNWSDAKELFRKAFLDFMETPEYISYMSEASPTFADHRNVIQSLYGYCCLENEEVHQFYEERNLFWADDLHDVQMMVGKTIKGIKEGEDAGLKLVPLFKDDEDREFGALLFRKTVQHAQTFDARIGDTTSNWEMDRIAFVDLILMRMALAELVSFQEIPVRVTLNEYIELSKLYSTPKSSKFINGVLDKLVIKFDEEKLFIKIGRGLL
jgi:N utilization substance protein B